MTRPLLRVATLLAGAAALAGCGSAAAPAASSPAATAVPWAGAVLVNPLPKPEFTLTTDAGRPFDFRRETDGRVTLLYFGYTHCPDACPTAMASIALALRQLPTADRSRVTTVFVTTDPARDDGPTLRRWLDQFDHSFVGLTGSPAAVNAAQDASALPVATRDPIPGASPGAYGVDHAAVILVFTPDGYAHLEWPDGVSTADVARDLQRLTTQGFGGA